jgi:hypothetical protein
MTWLRHHALDVDDAGTADSRRAGTN